jgi:lipopolysaccharide biosynthesis glycosyltransferase
VGSQEIAGGAAPGTPSVSSSEFAFVLAGDDGVGPALAVAMRSALTNLSRALSPEIYVLDNGLSASSRTRLLRVFNSARRGEELRWIRLPAGRLADLATRDRIPTATYCKLLIPELLPRHIRRVVYLDADVLVRRDLAPLFELNLRKAPLGAVRDFLDRPGRYFNAGVLVMNMEAWRMRALADRAFQYVAAHRDLHDLDQGALNAIVEDWCELDSRWNVQHGNLFFVPPIERPPPTEYTERLYRQRWHLYRQAVVLHFVGGAKPWFHWCRVPGTTFWVRTLIRSGWFTLAEALVWLLRWGGKRARFQVGMTSRRWRVRLVGGRGSFRARNGT